MSYNYPVFIIPMIVNLYIYTNQLMNAKKICFIYRWNKLLKVNAIFQEKEKYFHQRMSGILGRK